MKPKKLTKKEQRQLITMCHKVFPELQKKAFQGSLKYYGTIEDIGSGGGFYITGDGFIQCSYPIDERDDSFHEHLMKPIHWFEFLITVLLDRLAGRLGYEGYRDYISENSVLPNINEVYNLYKLVTKYDTFK
jgi:hypothetical protein